MPSRLLEDLELQARSATTPENWSRAICRSAIHLARQGSYKEAHELIIRVRSAFGTELHIDVASWVMLAEGVLHFTKSDSRQAYDRIRRAYGLAVALRTETARPSCAAWMALIEFNASQFDLMIAHLREVLADAKPDDHNARGRACLVLADAFQVAGRYDLGRPWYEKTRLHATAEGDQSTLSALLYNVAVFRTANVRLSDAFGILEVSDAKRAAMEANSSLSYDYAVGSTSFTSVGPMLYGQLLAIERRFEDASKLLDTIIESNLRKTEIPILLCDRAWCYAMIGKISEAAEILPRAEVALGDLKDSDDLAYAQSRLSQVSELCGDNEAAHRFSVKAHEALAAHRTFQESLLVKLNSLNLL